MRASLGRTALRLLLAVAIGLAAGLPVAWVTFTDSVRELTIGPHQATVRPAFDSHATLDFGPLLPLVRVPVDAPGPLGVDIRLGEAQVETLEELVQQDAVIASQPQGEIAEVRAAVTDMATVAALRGAGVTLIVTALTVGVWRGVGPRRRRRLVHDLRHPSGPQLVTTLTVVAALGVGVALVVTSPDEGERPEPDWVAVRSVFPQLPDDPVLDTLQVSDGSITRGSRALVEGALYLYEDSVSFYGELAETAAEAELRQPEEDEFTALVVADRHDNIGMDPVARVIADLAGAELLINVGDDTSQGDDWEQFSVNSLAREFDGLDKVAVSGNHDTATTEEQLRDAGFTVLEGEPVEVGGVRFLGDNDPRGTTLAGYTETAEERDRLVVEQDAELLEAACAADEAEERASVLVVHSWGSARDVAASGCTDLVLSGHLHYQVGPQAIEGDGDAPTTRLTIGSTGGAVFPIALGSKLRREAQVAVVTFDADGVPVGVQVVSFTPSGDVGVGEYVELPLPAAEAEDSDTDEPEDPEFEESPPPVEVE